MKTPTPARPKVKKYYGQMNLNSIFHHSLLDAVEVLLEKHEELIEQGFTRDEITYSDGDDIAIYAYREETDEETEKRIRDQKYLEGEELALYKQLKAKYGKLRDNDGA